MDLTKFYWDKLMRRLDRTRWVVDLILETRILIARLMFLKA